MEQNTMNATGVMTMGYGQCIMESVLRRRRQGGMGLLSKGENEGEDLLTPYSRRTRRFQRRWARLGTSLDKRTEKQKEMYIRTQLIADYRGLWSSGRPRGKEMLYVEVTCYEYLLLPYLTSSIGHV